MMRAPVDCLTDEPAPGSRSHWRVGAVVRIQAAISLGYGLLVIGLTAFPQQFGGAAVRWWIRATGSLTQGLLVLVPDPSRSRRERERRNGCHLQAPVGILAYHRVRDIHGVLPKSAAMGSASERRTCQALPVPRVPGGDRPDRPCPHGAGARRNPRDPALRRALVGTGDRNFLHGIVDFFASPSSHDASLRFCMPRSYLSTLPEQPRAVGHDQLEKLQGMSCRGEGAKWGAIRQTQRRPTCGAPQALGPRRPRAEILLAIERSRQCLP